MKREIISNKNNIVDTNFQKQLNFPISQMKKKMNCIQNAIP